MLEQTFIWQCAHFIFRPRGGLSADQKEGKNASNDELFQRIYLYCEVTKV